MYLGILNIELSLESNLLRNKSLLKRELINVCTTTKWAQILAQILSIMYNNKLSDRNFIIIINFIIVKLKCKKVDWLEVNILNF